MKIALPRKVMMIIKNLQLHGYEAYAVGGCVRDSILARRPKDWDITTSALPEQVKALIDFFDKPVHSWEFDDCATEWVQLPGTEEKLLRRMTVFLLHTYLNKSEAKRS